MGLPFLKEMVSPLDLTPYTYSQSCLQNRDRNILTLFKSSSSSSLKIIMNISCLNLSSMNFKCPEHWLLLPKCRQETWDRAVGDVCKWEVHTMETKMYKENAVRKPTVLYTTFKINKKKKWFAITSDYYSTFIITILLYLILECHFPHVKRWFI